MGYVFDFHDSVAYDRWVHNPKNKLMTDMETWLMINLLKPSPGESLLDIGCGTGSNLKLLLDKQLQLTGLDPSPYMLDIAIRNTGNRVDYYRGVGEDLPFEDNSFNHAVFFTTLEFVDNPGKALAEAFRVAKDRVFIGVLNRYAIKGVQRRVHGLFNQTIYNRARFFSIWEIKQMVRDLAGDVPVSWRTVGQFPERSGKLAAVIERSPIVQRFPFGTFVGVVVTLVPRFTTRPLAIKYSSKNAVNVFTGYAREVNDRWSS